MSAWSQWRWTAERTAHRARHAGYAVASAGMVGALFRVLSPELRRSPPPEAAREMTRRFLALLSTDLANVEAGWYPATLLRQLPVRDYLLRLPLVLADFPRIVTRRMRGRYDDLPETPPAAYPRYYLRNFHWQTDGWLSARSARMYDLGVELLFGGTADVMRRMAIPPIVRGVRGVRGVRADARPRILDVGCGTGRFMRQLSEALPGARMYGVDLSSYYIKEATRTLADVSDVSLVVDNAEHLPFESGTFDAVVSVFLFHELPRAVRRRVAAEMVRVLRPGGTMVVSDSAQFVESEAIRFFLERFAKTFHEPYYREYLRDDLETLFAQADLQALQTEAHAVSKVVSGFKPPAGG